MSYLKKASHLRDILPCSERKLTAMLKERAAIWQGAEDDLCKFTPGWPLVYNTEYWILWTWVNLGKGPGSQMKLQSPIFTLIVVLWDPEQGTQLAYSRFLTHANQEIINLLSQVINKYIFGNLPFSPFWHTMKNVSISQWVCRIKSTALSMSYKTQFLWIVTGILIWPIF